MSGGSGGVAIAGIGATAQGELPGRSANQIAVEAIEFALADAGLTKAEVDGLITCRNLQAHVGIDEQVGDLLGISPRFGATLDYGTGNFSLHLAAMAIKSGLAETIVLAYGTNQRSAKANFGIAVGGGAEMASVNGVVHVAGKAALAFKRHQHLYGTTEEQLGWISVAQREWARMNPLAIFRKPLTIEEYLASPPLVAPLRRADLTMISDGGAAMIVTTAERAKDLAKAPVHIDGMAQRTAFRGDHDPDSLMRPWLGTLADDLWATSGYRPEDIGALYIQDATSVWVLQMLEWYGFAPLGQGGEFVASGATRPGGSLPVNTNGGQLSEAYMWGWLHLVEAVRQLRGEAG